MAINLTTTASGITLVSPQHYSTYGVTTTLTEQSAIQSFGLKYDPELTGQSAALGGYPSLNMPLIKSMPWDADEMRLYGKKYRNKLFRDITAAECTAGVTLYRCLFVAYSGNSSNDAVTNLTCYVSNISSSATISYAVDTAPPAEHIATESTLPTLAGGSPLSWTTAPTTLTMSTSFAYTSNPIAIWFRYVIGSSTTPRSPEYWLLGISSDNYSADAWAFWNNLRAGVSIDSVVSDKENNVVGPGSTIQYTISTVNSAGTATDAAQLPTIVTTMDMSIPNMTYKIPPYREMEPIGSKAGVLIRGQAHKTTTGTYVFEFDPPHPGFFQHNISIGEDEFVYNQWVSAGRK